MEFVPKALQTPEVCLAAVTQDKDALEIVPKALKTPEVCLAAVTQCGGALKFVPKALRTPELCLAAVQQNELALSFVPITEEFEFSFGYVMETHPEHALDVLSSKKNKDNTDTIWSFLVNYSFPGKERVFAEFSSA